MVGMMMTLLMVDTVFMGDKVRIWKHIVKPVKLWGRGGTMK